MIAQTIERVLTSMSDAGVSAHIWPKCDQCVELLPLTVVQTEHVMQKSCV